MMWASSFVGDTYDLPEALPSSGSQFVDDIVKELAQHPNYKKKPSGLINIVIALQPKHPKEEEEPKETKKSHLPFSSSGEGWFESHFGKSADDLVRMLRKSRRQEKGLKGDIDEIIRGIRDLKSLEVEQTLKIYDWAIGKEEVIRHLGLSDRDLKSFRRYGDSRSVSLSRACDQWVEATGVIKTLESLEDVWDDDQKVEWSMAMQMRKEARKSWRHALHQVDTLAKHEQEWLHMASEELSMRGPMKARDMVNNLLDREHLPNNVRKSLTPMRLAKLLNTHGEELDIMKGATRGQYVLLKESGLVIKEEQVWPYAAGFLDADGYITITKRGEPRAGFIATGARGRVHCEQLQKTLGCGVLQLDQKVYKQGQKSQHRLQFYSKDDMRKLLNGVLPHLHMKKSQAKAVLAYLDAASERRSELQKFVQYENWRDTQKGQELLSEWGVTAESVAKWGEVFS